MIVIRIEGRLIMQEILLRKLIEKKFFTSATEVDAVHKGVDLSGRAMHNFENTFTVVGLMTSKNGGLILEAVSTADGSRRRIQPDQITKIDGMTPERFAENYMIAPDGGDIKVVGKRRGRRPKNWTADEEDF